MEKPASTNEIIPAEAVGAAVAEAYDHPGATATLIRRGFNDSYAVECGGQRALARVYLAGKYYLRDDGDIRYELELLRHLSENGVRVSAPVARADGSLLGKIVDAADVARPLALFTWAPGEALRGGELNEAVARAYGELIGAIHKNSSTFRSEYSRYRLDETFLVNQPADCLAALLGGDKRFAPYRQVFSEMREFLDVQPVDAPSFGYVHGDPHTGNMHADEAGQVTAFDFDHGGFGWRAYDVVTAGAGVKGELRAEFLAGYASIHALPGLDETSLKPWWPIRMLWDMGDMLAMAPVMGSDFAPPPDDCLKFLDKVAQQWRAARPTV